MFKQITIAAILFTAVTANAQQPTQKIIVAKGQKITIVDSLTMNIIQEAMGQTMEIPGNTYSNTLLEVRESGENKTVIATTLKKTSFAVNMMGQESKYNSENPEDKGSELGKPFEDKLNKTEVITVDDRGKTLSPERPAASKKEDEEGGSAADMIKNLTGINPVNAAENAFMLLPATAKDGTSWSDTLANEGIKTIRTYIIKSIEKNTAVITILGVISGSRKIEMQGMEMNMNTGGKVDGEIILDITTGMVKKRTIVIEPNNTIDIMGMSIPVTGKVTTVSFYTVE